MLDDAMAVAALAHDGQVRKGTDIPYVIHPFGVGLMLAQAGYPEEIIAAGILHDTVEDTDITLDYLREHFGGKVADIVEGCSEPDKSAPWEERKHHTLEYLRHAQWEVRLVACADKVHNLRTMVAEHKRIGEEIWTRFNRGRAKQEWYYRGLVESLCGEGGDGREIPFCAQLEEQVNELFGPQT